LDFDKNITFSHKIYTAIRSQWKCENGWETVHREGALLQRAKYTVALRNLNVFI